ncbi:hypothetical protein SAMN05192553_107141 [Cyclobacterium xiamenense]|uniref:Uncharacterized protein n=1 Tax=Cyclobacterium xiamenense TaxID=1297121 RepID=A0A1H7AKF4_9BACT|nr:hypothetical protein [Cyclobacterium xiamenense]SEJ66121.1 hypothetical protein SAMN05192553_107141 [Cyclobacterium xiamenense]
MLKNLEGSILAFIILISMPKMLSAQEFSTNKFKVIESGTSSKSTIIALVDQEKLKNPSLLFNKELLTTHNTSAYLFINTITLETFYAELNRLTRSSSSSFNKDALQLIIIGTQNELERYQSLDLNYFSSQYFISTNKSKANQSFITVQDKDWDCESYLESVKGKYLWGIENNRKSPKDSLINHEEGRLTIGYRPVMNFGLNNNNLGNYFSNGLSLDYQISKKIQLYAAGSFAIKRPEIEDEINNQVRSQIDIFGLITGSEQEVTLSIPIKSQQYRSASLGLRYLLTPEKDWSLYISTELSSNLSTKISGQLDTTFTVSSSIQNSFSAGNINEEAIGLVEREVVNINSGIGAGFQYKIGGRGRFDLSLTYSTSLRSVRSSDTFNNNTLNIAMGLNFRFKNKKEYEKIHFY